MIHGRPTGRRLILLRKAGSSRYCCGSLGMMSTIPLTGGAHGAMYIGVWGWNDKSGALCWIDDSDAEALGDPTYWMPLPDPPEDVHGR